jgi:hypothetical protein|tara:strand:+ start:2123 stop:2497 length:375 start_codon:yes stop_codon:yes gene_type:complete
MDFDPKEIGKIGRPSKWKLQQEGWAVYDEDGKDTSNYFYGLTGPKHPMYGRSNPKAGAAATRTNKKRVGSNNPMYTDGKSTTTEYRKSYYERNKVHYQPGGKYYRYEKVRNNDEFSKERNKRNR